MENFIGSIKKHRTKSELLTTFAPHAVCFGYIELKIEAPDKEIFIVEEVRNHDAGNVMVPYGDPFGTPSGGDVIIGRQLKTLIDALMKKVHEQFKLKL